jgi:hypothetical protein
MLNIVYLSYMEVMYSLYNVGYSKYVQLSMKKLFTHSIFRKVLGGRGRVFRNGNYNIYIWS